MKFHQDNEFRYRDKLNSNNEDQEGYEFIQVNRFINVIDFKEVNFIKSMN